MEGKKRNACVSARQPGEPARNTEKGTKGSGDPKRGEGA